MDNFDLVNFNEGEGKQPNPDPELEKPIPFDDSDSVTQQGANQVSRKPLTLGSNTASSAKSVSKPAQQPASRPAANPTPRPAPVAKPVVQANPSPVATADRITGMKIFVVKLHHGSLEYVEEQIATWLKENPAVTIKRTDVAVGEVQAKKTEPNLIISVWY